VLYNGTSVPEDCAHPGVRIIALPFTEIADRLGSSKVGNIVMLGALLETIGLIEQEPVVGALRRLVKNKKFFELDVAALKRGRDLLRCDDDSLWAV
jgi:Pyruvate/2-oxoacid:ferredoxin oxidoreductase gamma subunit